MSAPKSLINYLDKGGIKYEVVPHKKVYTAYDLAQTLGEKLDSVAKTVLVKVELPKVDKRGKYFVLVLPASYKVNLAKLKKSLKAKSASIVSEKELKNLKVTPGAVTPFGAYHKFGTLVDKALIKTRDALVSAGSHTESLRIKVKDLQEREEAIIGIYADKTKLKLQRTIKKAKNTVRTGKRVVKAATAAAKQASKGGKKTKNAAKKSTAKKAPAAKKSTAKKASAKKSTAKKAKAPAKKSKSASKRSTASKKKR